MRVLPHVTGDTTQKNVAAEWKEEPYPRLHTPVWPALPELLEAHTLHDIVTFEHIEATRPDVLRAQAVPDPLLPKFRQQIEAIVQ